MLCNSGMQREKSATATAMRMSDIVFSFLFQSLFTVDRADALSLVGAALVAGSIVIVVVFKQSRAVSEAAAEGGTSVDKSSVSNDIESESDNIHSVMNIMHSISGVGQYELVSVTDEELEIECESKTNTSSYS